MTPPKTPDPAPTPEDAPGGDLEPAFKEKEHADFYQQIRKRVRGWATANVGSKGKLVEVILAAPDLFHLLCRLAADPRVPTREKGKLVFAIAYFVSPLDLLPEGIMGPAGYLDDVALAAWVIRSMLDTTDPLVVREHWAGDGDVLLLIEQIVTRADDMLGSGLWRRIRKLLP